MGTARTLCWLRISIRIHWSEQCSEELSVMLASAPGPSNVHTPFRGLGTSAGMMLTRGGAIPRSNGGNTGTLAQ